MIKNETIYLENIGVYYVYDVKKEKEGFGLRTRMLWTTSVDDDELYDKDLFDYEHVATEKEALKIVKSEIKLLIKDIEPDIESLREFRNKVVMCDHLGSVEYEPKESEERSYSYKLYGADKLKIYSIVKESGMFWVYAFSDYVSEAEDFHIEKDMFTLQADGMSLYNCDDYIQKDIALDVRDFSMDLSCLKDYIIYLDEEIEKRKES